MVRCDIALVAGGITAYELAAVGVPAGYLSFVDNHLQNVREFAAKRWGPYLGDLRNLSAERLGKNITRFLSNPSSGRGRLRKIDGKGAQRIATEVVKLALRGGGR
jgi:spore coat polysaccharide biosynthesis predicted glycosyltransferase SpsG